MGSNSHFFSFVFIALHSENSMGSGANGLFEKGHLLTAAKAGLDSQGGF